MIVRDGGQFLDSMLADARSHVDEIVVADTGSTDGSQRVAASHGATVIDVPWTDDFAAARNASLMACRAEWLLSLDADENLATADWLSLRGIVQSLGDKAATAGNVVTRNYLHHAYSRRGWEPVPDPDPHALATGPVAPGFVPTHKVRLFPNDPRIRFRGRLHETVEASLGAAGLGITDIPLVVHHFGTLEDTRAKAERYLRLAQLKTREQPDDASAWAELAECSVATGDQPQALMAIERALKLEPGNPDRRLTAGWLLKEAGCFGSAESHLLAVAGAVAASDRQVGEACHLRAQIAMLDDRADAAGPLLTLAVRMSPADGHVHNTIGVWHMVCGRGDAALAELEMASRLLPHLPDPCLNLGRLYEASGHGDLAARQFAIARNREENAQPTC